MKKNKIIALTAAVVLTATAVIGGTLAYFTDTENATNTFTVGNVDIELHEKDAAGKPFVNDQVLVPTPGPTSDLCIDKVVTIENVGSEDAYVWAEILVPTILDKSESEGKEVPASLHLVYDEETVVIEAKGTETVGEGTKAVSYNKYIYYTIDSTDDTAYPIAPNESTTALLEKVYMDAAITQAEGEGYVLTNGETYTGSWDIIVRAYAIQSDGFENITAAMAAYYN